MLNKLNLFTLACSQFTNTVLSKFTHVPIQPAHGAINYNLNGYALVKRPWYGPDYQSEKDPGMTERTFTFEVAGFENSRDLLKFARELVRNVDTWERTNGIEQISQADLESFINVHSGADSHGCIVRWDTTDEDKDRELGPKDPDLIVVEQGTPEAAEHYAIGMSIVGSGPVKSNPDEAMLFELSFDDGGVTPNLIAFYWPASGHMDVENMTHGQTYPHELPFKYMTEERVIEWLQEKYQGCTAVRQKGSDIPPS